MRRAVTPYVSDFEDVTLGSEYSDLQPISVEGAVTAEIGDAAG